MNIKTVAGIVSALAVILGSAFALDGRYLHKAEASELVSQQKADYITLRLEILRAKLTYLTNKPNPTMDEKNEIEFLREQIKQLQAKLQ